MNDDKNAHEFSNDQIARRKLLALAAYVPPAILGIMVTGNNVAEAARIGSTINCPPVGMVTVSAGGNACCPCVSGSAKYNAAKCTKERCKLGHCASCKQMTWTKKKDCTKKLALCGGCTCTESPPGSGFWTLTGGC